MEIDSDNHISYKVFDKTNNNKVGKIDILPIVVKLSDFFTCVLLLPLLLLDREWFCSSGWPLTQ